MVHFEYAFSITLSQSAKDMASMYVCVGGKKMEQLMSEAPILCYIKGSSAELTGVKF